MTYEEYKIWRRLAHESTPFSVVGRSGKPALSEVEWDRKLCRWFDAFVQEPLASGCFPLLYVSCDSACSAAVQQTSASKKAKPGFGLWLCRNW